MLTLQELKEFLEKEREDLIELRDKSDLTDEGKGQLEMINLIFEKIGWGIEKNLDIENESSEIEEEDV